MAAPKDAGDARHAIDSDVDFAGYDPYIVAITGGGPANISGTMASAPNQANKGQATESRKVKLMTWLREHRA